MRDGVKMYLSQIKIRNFRCIDHVELDLKPITVIYGMNGSGKSSILAALQLLKQSKQTRNLQTKGTMNFGKFKNLVRNLDENQWVSIGFKVSFDKDEFSNQMFFSDISEFDRQFKEIRLPIKNAEYEASFREINGALELNQAISLNGVRLIQTESSKQKGSVRSRFVIPNINAAPTNQDVILNDDLGYFQFQQSSITESEQKMMKVYGELVKDIVRIFCKALDNYFIIGPTRAARPFETQMPTNPKWVGYEGEDATGLLSKIWGSAELSQKRTKISKWAETFGLPDLWAGFQGDTKLGVTFRDPQTGTPVNLNWAGHGSKQMLILITQMFYGDEGEIIALEEPEISLHLQLQTELPKLFADVVKEKKQVIVTSHSSQFLTAFRRSFRDGTLTTNELAVFHLKTTKKGTLAEKLMVTEQGIVVPFIPSIAKAEKRLISEAFK